MEPSTEQNNHLQIKEHKIHIRFTLTYLLTMYYIWIFWNILNRHHLDIKRESRNHYWEVEVIGPIQSPQPLHVHRLEDHQKNNIRLRDM
jgi:hypothetical protein